MTCRHINDGNEQRAEPENFQALSARDKPKIGKAAHIQATARDAIAVSIGLDYLKVSIFRSIKSWPKGRP